MSLVYVILGFLFMGRVYSAGNIQNLVEEENRFSEISNGDAKIFSSNNVQMARTKTLITLGKRSSRDVKLEHGEKTMSYNVLQDVNVLISYPSRGIGKKVTCVEIEFETSGMTPTWIITKGGIEQTYITISVTTKQTLYAHYKVVFYSSAGRAQPYLFSLAIILGIILSNKMFRL